MSDKTTIKSLGWMGCAIQAAGGKFFPAMVSDDADGVVRFYIDKSNMHMTADDAIRFANYGRGLGRYRTFSHVYTINQIGDQPDEE